MGGLTAILDTGQFLERVPSLHPLLEDAVRSEKDQSVVIHALRLLKTIGKCGNSMDEVVGIETEKRLLHFWLGKHILRFSVCTNTSPCIWWIMSCNMTHSTLFVEML